MRIIGLFSLLFITSISHAEITTQKEADVFLEKYCIALVGEIERSYVKQNNHVFKKDWKGNNAISINELADVYSKLCVKN